ncbi:TIGR03086 family metal-binding protein [Lentzea sp. JNUCC 0626]|uniref:TIGR03086 family metal-binding protein n=1 Tax=Lentzea sp. JNUCC 0626 TaxID=3367513 RepID=UPI003748F04B
MLINDLLKLHRTAVETSVELVSKASADDLGNRTPCAEWTLADLLAHMTTQHRGFAAAARGNGNDLTVWEVRPATVAEHVEAAADLLAAFAEPEVPQRVFDLPEFGASFPALQAVGFHFIDYVVHGWDVARSLGLDYRLAPELAEPALRIALSVPDAGRGEPGAPFAPAVTSNDDDPLHRILAALGRAPEWS